MYRVFNHKERNIMTPQTITQDITMSQEACASENSALECTPTTDDIKVAAQGFTNLNLSENLLKALADMNFSDPSSIQAEAIPQMMKGIDVIAKAPTGSGKTAAFAIPILEKMDLNSGNRDVQALVLCPTRELAIQVHREFEKLTKYMDNISVVSVYGGQPIDRQLTALRKKPQIVVATPGRLMDHLRRGSVSLTSISMVVLDEADEMLDMGFRDDIHTILEDTPENRQTVLFSATMAKDIITITKKFQKTPLIVDVMDNLQSVPDIDQSYFEVSEKGKVELLTRLLDLHNVKLALVFCNTKSNVDRVVEVLKTRGYFADSLHGDMNQSQREKVMRGFRSGSVEILVATDVAGRGIDVKNIEAVFNYDLPRDDEDYIHRVGRTGRAGESGCAFTFITRSQVQSIKRIERANGVLINKKEVPTYEELESARVTTYETKIQNIIDCDDLTDCVNKVQAMVDKGMSMEKIAAALLKMSMNKESKKINKNVSFEENFSDDDSRNRSRGSRGGRSGGGRNDRGGRSGGGFGGGGFGGGRSRNGGGSRDGVAFDRPQRSERPRTEGSESFDRKPRFEGERSERPRYDRPRTEGSEGFTRRPRTEGGESFGRTPKVEGPRGEGREFFGRKPKTEGGEGFVRKPRTDKFKSEAPRSEGGRKFGDRKKSSAPSLDGMIQAVKSMGETTKPKKRDCAPSKPRSSKNRGFEKNTGSKRG